MDPPPLVPPKTVQASPPPLKPPKRVESIVQDAEVSIQDAVPQALPTRKTDDNGQPLKPRRDRLSLLRCIEEIEDDLRKTLPGEDLKEDTKELITLFQRQSWVLGTEALIGLYGVTILAELLNRFPEDLPVQRKVVDIVSTLSFTPEGRKGLGQANVIRFLLPLLSYWASDVPLATAGAKALVNFTVIPELREWVLMFDPLPVVCQLLSQHTDADILKECFRFVTNMCFQQPLEGVEEDQIGFRPQQDEMVIRSDVLGGIKKAMEATMELNSSTVHYEGLRAIFNLTYRNTTNKTRLVNLGFIELIADSIQRHPSVENVLMYGFQTLINMCLVSESYRAKIKETSVIGVVSAAKDIPNAKLYTKLLEFEKAVEGTLAIQQGMRLPGDLVPDQNANTYDVPLPIGVVVHGLDKRIKASQLSGDLMLFIPFFICFLFFYLVPAPGVESIHVLEGMRNQMEGNEFPDTLVYKNWFDIANPGDWYTWFEGVALPTLWTEPEGKMPRFILGGLIPVGALRIRSQHVTPTSCEVTEPLYQTNATHLGFSGFSVFEVDTFQHENTRIHETEAPHFFEPPVVPISPLDCFAGISSSAEDKTLSIGFAQEEIPTLQTLHRGHYEECEDLVSGTTGYLARYHCGGNTFDIPFNSTLADARAVVAKMKQRNFIIPVATRFVSVEGFFYSTNADLWLGMNMFMELAPGGAWIGRPQWRIFRVWSKRDFPQTLYDCFFMLFVVFYIYRFFREFYRDRVVFKKRPFKYFFKIWNLLEIVNLAVFLVVFGMKIRWLQVSGKLEESDPPFTLATKEFPEDLNIILLMYSFSRYFNAINTVICFLKFLKFVDMKDGLNVLTRTLAEVNSKLSGLLMLFLFLTLGFALAGTTVYGLGDFEFRDVSTSYSSLIRIVLGDFDYVGMREENKFITPLFFTLYVCLALFMYMNFIVAVITDGFSVILENQKKETIAEQVHNAAKYLRWSFSFSAIIKKMQMVHRNKTLSVVLRDVLNKYIVPFRERIRAIQNWAKLRTWVRTQLWRTVPAYVNKVRQIQKEALGEVQRENLWQKVLVQAASEWAPDVPTDEIEVKYSTIKRKLPPSVVKLLGEVYLREIWLNMVYQQEKKKDNPAEREKAGIVEVAKAEGNKQAMKIESKLVQTRAKLNRIEKQLEEIQGLATFGKKGVGKQNKLPGAFLRRAGARGAEGNSTGSRTPPALTAPPLDSEALNVRIKEASEKKKKKSRKEE